MSTNAAGIAIVTGANRGIGLEVCRQLAERGFTVILGSRDLAKGQQAAAKLARDGITVLPRQLDVINTAHIEQLRKEIEADFGHLDVLINNAATHYDSGERVLNANIDIVREALEANTLSAWQMCSAFVPLMRRSTHGRIINVSSQAGSLSSMGSYAPAYAMSKAALNALTRMLAAELRDSKILVNSICPGWVATDMGGRGGRPVEQGAASIMWAVMLPDDGPSGGFFRDGKPVPW